MESYIEQYQAKDGDVTLHTWTDIEGWKKENFYITGPSGSPVPLWFREVLRQKHLADIVDFPYGPHVLMPDHTPRQEPPNLLSARP